MFDNEFFAEICREYSYELRVQLLEALDYDAAIDDLGTNDITQRTLSSFSNSGDFETNSDKKTDRGNDLSGNRFCEDDDLAR